MIFEHYLGWFVLAFALFCVAYGLYAGVKDDPTIKP